MNVLSSSGRARALVGITSAAVAVCALSAPAASAANVPADAAHTGLYGASSATYDGVYRQSLTILGIKAAGQAPDTRAVDWLLDQQCTDGGFTSFDADPSTQCAGSTDSNATALAAQALLAVGEVTEGLAAAEQLQDTQLTDGGWEYTPGSGWGADPNSTGLALTALNAAELTPTHDAVAYFAALQIGRTLPAKFEGDEGGIASPYSNGYGDGYATPQTVPGLAGDHLVEIASPSFGDWNRTATPPAVTPAADAAGIAGWAAVWLDTNATGTTIPASLGPWTVLSLASAEVGRTAAEDVYTRTRANVPSTNPGALGQAAMAATALGETADAQRFAALAAATLTTAAGRDADASDAFALSVNTAWTEQAVKVSNPYAGSDLPMTLSVLWGDGTSSELTGTTATHEYASAGTYEPRVRVEYDDFPRAGFVDLDSITVTKPTAAITLSKASAWLGASVTLTKGTITGEPTSVVVAWGDGTTSDITSAAKATHTYRTAGTFAPTVTASNADGGTATFDASPTAVVVSKDTGKPAVSIVTPSAPAKAGSWKPIRGTASDAGIGVKQVTVVVVERRSGDWYAFTGSGWKKKSSLTQATKAAKRIVVTPTAGGSWSARVGGITKGKLRITAMSTDKAGNSSASTAVTQKLTKK